MTQCDTLHTNRIYLSYMYRMFQWVYTPGMPYPQWWYPRYPTLVLLMACPEGDPREVVGIPHMHCMSDSGIWGCALTGYFRVPYLVSQIVVYVHTPSNACRVVYRLSHTSKHTPKPTYRVHPIVARGVSACMYPKQIHVKTRYANTGL